MNQEIDEKIGSSFLNPIDIYVKKIDEKILKAAQFFNFKTLVCECAVEQGIRTSINIFSYKYDPEKDFKGPLIKINYENVERLTDYIKNHPNKVVGIILDFNEFRNGKINFPAFNTKLNFFERHKIPLIFGSGANNVSEIVPPVTLKVAVEYFTPLKNINNSKVYKNFYNNIAGVLVQGKYFETHKEVY